MRSHVTTFRGVVGQAGQDSGCNAGDCNCKKREGQEGRERGGEAGRPERPDDDKERGGKESIRQRWKDGVGLGNMGRHGCNGCMMR